MPRSTTRDAGCPGRRQRSDVARQQRQRLVDLERAGHEEREVGGVREALAVEGGHLRAIERLDPLGRERPRRAVPRGIHLGEAVSEDLLRRLLAVGDGRRQLACQQGERLRVVVGRGEVQVEQLQRRFELRGRRAAGNAMRRKRNVGRGRGQLAGQQPLQVERLEAADASQSDVRGR